MAPYTSKREFQQEIIHKLRDSEALRQEEARFGKYLDSIGWWIISRIPAKLTDLQHKLSARSSNLKTYLKKKSVSVSPIRKALIEADKSKRLERFHLGSGIRGFVYPLLFNNKIYGYIGTCYPKKEVDGTLFDIFASFTDTVVLEAEKELELAKLYETVRPRAIALSTVHTVHRLISSTLDLNELLPRIARLTLQVLRANRCSIKLVDSKRKLLIPKTTVDLRKKKARLKKVRIGRWAPGKAVKQAKCIRGENYLATPLIDEDVIGVITLYDKIDKKPFTSFDEEIMTTLAEQAVIAIKNAQLYKEQEKLTIGGIKSLAAVLEAQKPKTYRQPKVSLLKITMIMGQELGMDEHELKSLEYASVLHDAGQLVVPDQVLAKPTKLTGREYEMVKEHPLKSVKFIRPMRALRSVIPIILHHHENYDGSGYPKGLKKEQIPLGARIMAIIGAFEAMVTKRPYRIAMGIGEATEEIKKNSETQFDPKVVAVFLKVIKRSDVRTMLEKEIGGSK